MKTFHDIVGIGFGPANIAIAIAAEELYPEMDVHFLESKSEAQWHPDMMLTGADIQNNPLRDLVTPRNPRSQYTFVNFLKETDRLFDHLNLGVTFPLRVEYNQYVKWVASHFTDKVSYQCKVTDVQPYFEQGQQKGYEVTTETGDKFYAKAVVFAPGRTPFVPSVLNESCSDRIFHFNSLLSSLSNIEKNNGDISKIAIVGSSQSAVEIALYLRSRYPTANITNVIRNFGIRQKDLSPFTGEVFYPEFASYYHNASKEGKQALDKDLRYTNYSSADSDVVNQLYLNMYEDKILNVNRHEVLRNMDIQEVNAGEDEKVNMVVKEKITGEVSNYEFDAVISATGFRDIGTSENQEQVPSILRTLDTYIQKDSNGCVQIGFDYELPLSGINEKEFPLMLNGLCEKSHGMGDAGSFSLLSLRSEQILNHVSDCISKPSERLAG